MIFRLKPDLAVLAIESGVLPYIFSIFGSAARMMRNLRREGSGCLDAIEVCMLVFAQYPMFREVDSEGNIAKSDSENRLYIVPLL